MGDDEFTFEDPPKTRVGPGAREALAALLDAARSRPGEWLKVNQPASSSGVRATNIKRRHPGFEATTRAAGVNEAGRRVHTLYIRYIGEAS